MMKTTPNKKFWLMTVRVLRESFTKNGSRRRSLFISAIVALWIATSLPAAPIAMPMSPAAGAKQQVETLGLVQIHRLKEIIRHAIVLEPLRAAHEDGRTLNIGLDATTGGFRKIFRFGQRHARFPGKLRKRLGRGMIAVFF